MRAFSWREQEQDRSSLKAKLYTSVSACASRPRRPEASYRDENISAVDEIQGTKKEARLGSFVSLRPALGQENVFRLEFAAELAGESGFQRRQQHSDGIVPAPSRQRPIGGIGELQWRRAQGFRMVDFELVGGSFLSSQSPCDQEGGRQKNRPEPHFTIILLG